MVQAGEQLSREDLGSWRTSQLSQAVLVTAYGHEADRSTWYLLWDVAESPPEHPVPAEPVPRAALGLCHTDPCV